MTNVRKFKLLVFQQRALRLFLEKVFYQVKSTLLETRCLSNLPS